MSPSRTPRSALVMQRARDEEVPLVYVNDNYGDWNSSSGELVEAAMDGSHPELVEPLRPPQDAMFVIKARHSIFAHIEPDLADAALRMMRANMRADVEPGANCVF